MSDNGIKYAALDTAFKRRSHSIFRDILKQYAKSDFPLILDVGCASGIIGQLRGSAKNVFGIERDTALLSMAREHCEKVYCLDLNRFQSTDMQEYRFDFIFCGDIIEHVIAPLDLLKELHPLLKDDGRLVVSVPNVAQLPVRLGLLLGRFERTETGILDKSHLHFFTFRTASRLLEQAGFEIERSFASGTVVSFVPVCRNLLAAQFVFLCRKK